MKCPINTLILIASSCIYIFVGCKKTGQNTKALFDSTKRYHRYSVSAPGDTVRYADTSYTITRGSDLVWNGITFKYKGQATSSVLFDGNTYDEYVVEHMVPGHHGYTAQNVIDVMLLYCAATDQVFISSGNYYWMSF